MFRPKGLFKDIPCPKQHDCQVPNCIFSHELEPIPLSNGTANTPSEYDPLSAGELSTRPLKRRRLSSPEITSLAEVSLTSPSAPVASGIRGDLNGTSGNEAPPAKVLRASVPAQDVKKSTSKATFEGQKTPSALKPVTSTRPISPPPTSNTVKAVMLPHREQKPEPLAPRQVLQSPAQHGMRLKVIEEFRKHMETLNEKIEKGEERQRCFKLNGNELTKVAVDEEHQFALHSKPADIYRNAVAQRLKKLKNMSVEEWTDYLMKKLGKGNAPKPTSKVQKQDIGTPVTGLPVEGEIAVLRPLKTALAGLDKYGYVTTQPSQQDVETAKRIITAMGNYEICDRCSTRFQVFPGRDEQGQLTTQGPCRYHWARSSRGQFQATDRTTGYREQIYACCNQPLGAEGCSESESHVFKVDDPKRLAAILQFEHTPSSKEEPKRKPVAFDCEMGYTTCGMEVIRVTAVSWPQKQQLLDILVRPYGEILDLNTRFSGVSQAQYANAPPYEHSVEKGDDNDSRPLQKVESPEAARGLLFDLISPETPLIGHAINNDLNVMRIIHPFVVDTVLLYPHPKGGLPNRYGLKVLSEKFLHRTIQSSSELGHDSKEDAIATADLVLYKVAEKWKTLKLQGWKFEDGGLVAPTIKTKAHKAVM